MAQSTPHPQLTVTLARSRHGNPQPQLEIRLPNDSSPRVLSASLHRFAAEVELMTPPDEKWIVRIEMLDSTRGLVFLELMDATPTEAERAMAVLRGILDGQRTK